MPVAASSKRFAYGTTGRCLAGWFLGYLISLVSSIALFLLARIPPEEPTTTGVFTLIALYGIGFAVLAGWVGAGFSRENASGIGIAIAFTILIVAVWSWTATPLHVHWSQSIAILLMAPSAFAGGWLRSVR
ncbi:hypothetical protein [Acidicapsa ligni]|uniref:hypothetical protein n=1 Tax=Acidicapsa ligni TaxID=542300 RepID=UPI0021E0E17B|nr:hypothetical protein [Acidicapsa ligni]